MPDFSYHKPKRVHACIRAATDTNREVNEAHIFLPQCIKISGVQVCQLAPISISILTISSQIDWYLIEGIMGISADAACMRYARRPNQLE